MNCDAASTNPPISTTTLPAASQSLLTRIVRLLSIWKAPVCLRVPARERGHYTRQSEVARTPSGPPPEASCAGGRSSPSPPIAPPKTISVSEQVGQAAHAHPQLPLPSSP